jgi:hypothetical protein
MKALFMLIGVAALSACACADLNEGFDDITTLTGSGWSMQNLSSPAGIPWFQGNQAVFGAQAGTSTVTGLGYTPASYIAENDRATSGTAATGDTISVWLTTPQLTMNNGDTFSFWTSAPPSSAFADRLEVRESVSGASTNVGTSATSVGDFTNLLATINPNLVTGANGYPTSWTKESFTISGLSGATSGRLAMRYFVTDGGAGGNNSNYIGIDTFNYTVTPAPEPASIAAIGLGALVLVRRRRK